MFICVLLQWNLWVSFCRELGGDLHFVASVIIFMMTVIIQYRSTTDWFGSSRSLESSPSSWPISGGEVTDQVRSEVLQRPSPECENVPGRCQSTRNAGGNQGHVTVQGWWLQGPQVCPDVSRPSPAMGSSDPQKWWAGDWQIQVVSWFIMVYQHLSTVYFGFFCFSSMTSIVTFQRRQEIL